MPPNTGFSEDGDHDCLDNIEGKCCTCPEGIYFTIKHGDIYCAEDLGYGAMALSEPICEPDEEPTGRRLNRD